jgi:hypothetical protein
MVLAAATIGVLDFVLEARVRIQPREISASTDVEPNHAGAAPVYHEMLHPIYRGKIRGYRAVVFQDIDR